MNRRRFVAGAASAGMGASAVAAGSKNAIFELRYFWLRNGNQAQRTSEFIGKHYLPAARRAGAGPMGFFAAVIAEQSPFLLALTGYSSLAGMESTLEQMASDTEFQKRSSEYDSPNELSYIRMENTLLRGFDTMPQIVVPSSEDSRAARIFELRTYESNTAKAGKRKIRMFEEGEIGVFKRLGMAPVFFGEAIVGRNLPHLTYMLAFDDLAHREKAWRAFGSDPEWQKMRAMPGVSDPEIVSNISNAILRPLPFSPIK